MLLIRTPPKYNEDSPPQNKTNSTIFESAYLSHLPSDLNEESDFAQWLPVCTPEVHANSLLELESGHLACVWFGGSKEGAADVGIYLSRYCSQPRQGGSWSPAQLLLNREVLKSRFGIRWVRKIGNPVLHRDAQGLFHLFVVTVAMGGWAASRIEHFVCESENLIDWHYRGRLPISPWPNISHLVRAPAVNLVQGGFILPAYYELGRKYGVLLRFNIQGDYQDKIILQNPSAKQRLIQPWPVCHLDGTVGFFFRDSSRETAYERRIHFCKSKTRSLDAAADLLAFNAMPMQALNFPNPDASVAAIATADRGYWLVHNPDTPDYRWRRGLLLQRLDAQFTVQKTIWLERGEAGSEFSYPSILATKNGQVHIIYTYNRQTFRHRVFSNTK